MNGKQTGPMDCGVAREQFPLMLYGELRFDEEERVDAHLDGCAECRAAFERARSLHVALASVEIEPSAGLLRECREDLSGRLMGEGAPRAGWWEQFTDMLAPRRSPEGQTGWGMGPRMGWLRPAGALTLVAIGFLAARMTPFLNSTFDSFTGMSAGDIGGSRVRTVEPQGNGQVKIVLDETRQRVVSGRLDDQQIRALLLGAAKDPSDAGLRAETVDILNANAQSTDVRDALVYALRHDQNAGVRLKAIEGLKSFAREPEVRGALEQVLLSDANPGMRTTAIDLLTAGPGQDLDRQMVGTLQELMNRESNTYVRQRVRNVLESVKASAETY